MAAFCGWSCASALKYIRWIAAQANADSDLSEQVPTHLLHPATRQKWVDRWAAVAIPSLWSHGMYLILADELGLTRANDAVTAPSDDRAGIRQMDRWSRQWMESIRTEL